MKKTRIYIFILVLMITFSLLGTNIVVTQASSYNYDVWGNPIPSSEGLTYKDTYYGENIIASDNSGQRLTFSSSLEDFVVYQGLLYLVDGRDNTTESIELPIGGGETKVDTIKNNSHIYVINSKMQWERQINKLFFADSEADRLLEKITNYTSYSKSYMEVTHKELSEAAVANRAPFAALKDDQGNWKPGVYLNYAQGITVTDLGIYIADTENSRIFKLNFNFEIVEVYFTPVDQAFLQYGESEDTSGKLKFRPIRLAVDRTGRVYVVAKNAYVGLLEYSSDGKFNRYLGKNLVTINAWESFLAKWFYSEEQMKAKGLNLPPLFTNITIDKNGFLYTTTSPDSITSNETIKAINTSGKDVLKRNGYIKPIGDNVLLAAHNNKTAIIGASNFTAITINDDGIYTAVDSTRGRLFTYDNEGNLLYVTGEKDIIAMEKNRADCINNPVAITYYDLLLSDGTIEQQVFVLDNISRSIIVFKTTEFGKLVNRATSLYLNSDSADLEEYGYDPIHEAAEIWEEVIRMNTNYTLGYVGIGKSMLRQGNYKEAMENFRKGHNPTYYSKAFQLYRDDIIKENFNIIMSGTIILLMMVTGLVVYKRINRRRALVMEGNDE